MAYDPESDEGGALKAAIFERAAKVAPDTTDVRQVLALVDLAALELSPYSGASFTREALFELARNIGGDDFVMTDEALAAALKACTAIREVEPGVLAI